MEACGTHELDMKEVINLPEIRASAARRDACLASSLISLNWNATARCVLKTASSNYSREDRRAGSPHLTRQSPGYVAPTFWSLSMTLFQPRHFARA